MLFVDAFLVCFEFVIEVRLILLKLIEPCQRFRSQSFLIELSLFPASLLQLLRPQRIITSF